jgi:hypothetical protein
VDAQRDHQGEEGDQCGGAVSWQSWIAALSLFLIALELSDISAKLGRLVELISRRNQ